MGALARCLDWVAKSGAIPFNPLRNLPRGYARYTPDDAAVVLGIEGGRASRSGGGDRLPVGVVDQVADRQAITASGSGCKGALDAEWHLRDHHS